MEQDNQHTADLTHNFPSDRRVSLSLVSHTTSQPVIKWVGKMCKDVVSQDTQHVWQTAHTVLSPSLKELGLPGCKHSSSCAQWNPSEEHQCSANTTSWLAPTLPQLRNMQGISAGDSGTPIIAWELLYDTAHTTESSGMAGRIMEDNSCGVRNHNSSAYAGVRFQESRYLSSDVCLFYWLSTWLYCCL